MRSMTQTSTSGYVPKDVQSAVRQLGIEPARITGDEIWARCPGHPRLLGRQDRNVGSWSVNAKTGQHFCYACGFGGSFLSLVKWVTGYEQGEAKGWIVKHGLRLEMEAAPEESGEYAPQVDEASLVLFTSVPRLELERRNLSRESARHYGILWDYREDRWVLPIRMPDGTLLGWQYKDAQGTENYPAGMQKRHTLFGIDVVEPKTLILVESPLDAVRIHSVGYDGAVASVGSYVRPEQIDLIDDRSTSLLLAMDDDPAGWKSAEKIYHALRHRMSIFAFNYDAAEPTEDQKDPGDMDDEQIVAGIENAQEAGIYPEIRMEVKRPSSRAR